MTRENAKRWLHIIEAHANGEQIQYKGPVDTKWSDIEEPSFCGENQYRIKPKPREFWVNVYTNEVGIGYGYASRKVADDCAAPNRLDCIHVREVMDE